MSNAFIAEDALFANGPRLGAPCFRGAPFTPDDGIELIGLALRSADLRDQIVSNTWVFEGLYCDVTFAAEALRRTHVRVNNDDDLETTTGVFRQELSTAFSLFAEGEGIAAFAEPETIDRIFQKLQLDSPTRDEEVLDRGRSMFDRIRARQVFEELVVPMALTMQGSFPTPESLQILAQYIEETLGYDNAGAIQLRSAEQFCAEAQGHQWLIENVLVQGQPIVFGGPKKALKTSFSIDLGVTLAAGAPCRFLGYFQSCESQRVGMLSGESGETTLSETVQRVCRFKNVALTGLSLFIDTSLPSLDSPAALKQLDRLIRRHQLSVLIIDPLYLCLIGAGSKASAASMFDMGPLLRKIATTCLEAGATPILIHHNVKSPITNDNRPQLEHLAFAGIQEFARQWILLARRERYKHDEGIHRLWMEVGGSAGQSGCFAVDVVEGRLDAQFLGRRWEVTVNTEAQHLQEREANQQNERENSRQQQLEEDCRMLVSVLTRNPAGLTRSRMNSASTISRVRTDRAFSELYERGQLEDCDVMQRAGRGVRAYAGFRLISEHAPPFASMTIGRDGNTSTNENSFSGETNGRDGSADGPSISD